MYGNVPNALLWALSSGNSSAFCPGVLWPYVSSCGINNMNQAFTAAADTTAPRIDSGLGALRLVGARGER